jgi:hypothetical protein
MDYLEKLESNRSSGPEHAATAKPRRKRRPRKRGPIKAYTPPVGGPPQPKSRMRRRGLSLTGPRKRAKLKSKRADHPPGKKAGSTTKDSSEKPKMAKKKRSAAQRRATAKMLRANKARRAGKRATPKRRRKSAGRRKARKSGGKRKSAKRVAAGKKAARTRKRHKAERKVTRKAGKRRARKSTKRSRARARSRTRSVKVVRMPRRASRVVVVTAPPKMRRRKSTRRKARKGGGRRRNRRISSRSAKKYGWGGGHKSAAMENPMDGVELFIGSVTGLVGFATADFVDRLLATHALTGTAAPFTDTPPTTGDYAGLFNAAAICAPMNATRWAVGLGIAAVPLIIAHFVEAPKGRAALQFFGYAAGIRVVGKGLIDAIAQLAMPSQLGQQLYDGEMRANALKAGQGTIASTVSLPSSGLGRARLGAGRPAKPDCANCAKGLPCNGPNAKKPTGAGWPSYPREVTTTTQTQPQPTAPPANTATTTPATPPAPPAGPNQLTGVPRRSALPQRSSNWGYQGD